MTTLHARPAMPAPVDDDAGAVARAATIATARPLSILEGMGRKLIRRTLATIERGDITLVDRDQRHQSPERAADLGRALGLRPATVYVRNPRFYSAAAFGGDLGVAEAYLDGLWDSDNLPALIEILAANEDAQWAMLGPAAAIAGAIANSWARTRRNSLAGARKNIAAHYDLGNEFFALFLDSSMTYSCGIFENGATTLEEAQTEKIDRACRKLRLNPDDHLLEIGTGWGSLAIHAARNYGCRVTTTTISPRQHQEATRRIREAGLEDRITVLLEDFRRLEGSFSKLVSIEMIEAIGEKNFAPYFAACSRLLRPDGLMLVQAITMRDRDFRTAASRTDFLKRYIFPGSCLPSSHAMMSRIMRVSDLHMVHLEEIGAHYATTLSHWRSRFLRSLDQVRAMGFDDRFIRMWDYYLAYCEGTFRSRRVGDIQMLLAKPLARISPDEGWDPRPAPAAHAL